METFLTINSNLILTYIGDDSCVGQTIEEIKKVLDSEALPKPGEGCEYCEYRRLIGQEERIN